LLRLSTRVFEVHQIFAGRQDRDVVGINRKKSGPYVADLHAVAAHESTTVDDSGLAASEAVTYSFRNRFRLHEGDRLDADVPEIKLADSTEDGLVTLWPVQREVGTSGGGFIFAVEITKRGTLVSQADELVLQGDGYFDADATVAGRKWRQYLTVALAREGKGVDFGADDQVTPAADIVYEDDPPELVQRIGIEVGHRVITDDPRLLVFPTTPIPKFVNFVPGTPTVKLSGWLERFEQRVKDIRERDQQPWSREKRLAYQLVHLALADSNPETRHIQLVTAIEVLFKKQNRPKPILDALKVLLAEVKKWPDSQNDVKTRMAQILNSNKEESINRAGREQVAAMLTGKYTDKSAAAFFEHVYDMRSGLVHREKPKKPRPKIEDIREVQSELLRFVLDLLDAYDSD
jgi:Apea-like HEPN